MLLNGFADLCRSAGWYWDVRLWSWVVYNGKRLAGCDHVIHCCRHDDSEVSIGTSSSIGWDGSRILFEIVAETCECVIGGLPSDFARLEGEAVDEVFGGRD